MERSIAGDENGWNGIYRIIYGAGKVGIGLLELLTQYNINIKAFAQTDLRNNENENISGIPLKGIDEIINDEDDILLVASKNYSESMMGIAKQMEFKNIIDVSKYI